MQPFNSISQDFTSTGNLPTTCELVTFDSAFLNVFAAEVNYCPPHWHPAPELLYVLEGGFSLIVNEQEIILNKGDFLFIGADTIHSLEFRQPESTVLTWQFQPDLFASSALLHQRFAHFAASHKQRSVLRDVSEAHLALLTDPATSPFHQQAGLFNLLGMLDTFIEAPVEVMNTAAG